MLAHTLLSKAKRCLSNSKLITFLSTKQCKCMNKNLSLKTLGTNIFSLLKKVPRTMRLGFLFLILCIGMVNAEESYAQRTKISMNVQNERVSNILEAVENQTDFTFVYDAEAVNVNRRASVDVENQNIFEVLTQLFRNTDVAYTVVNKKIILNKEREVVALQKSAENKAENQQQVGNKITGTVVDGTGEPVIGANVIQKGANTNGTITDADGKFSLNIPKNASFVVSYIGFISQEIQVAGKSSFKIVLVENAKALDEVVVVGYGSVKKSNLTSAVSKITDEAMKDRPITMMSEAFQGQLAGVQAQATGGGIPGQEFVIRVRGLNSINGDSSPLYVIDGVPRDNMKDINPTDISSIQVLKDASATSIYGARGGNGVILIETKKGAGKPAVTFEGYYGFQNAEKLLDLESGPEWVAYNMYKRNCEYLRAGGKMSDPMSARPVNYQIPDSWASTTDFTDWQKEVLRSAPIQNYQASASAKGDIGNIYFSAGYMDQEGIIKYTDYNKINTRLNASMNISKKLRVGVNLGAVVSDQELAGSNSGNGKESAVHHAMMISPMMKTTEGTRDWGTPSYLNVGDVYPNPVQQLKYTTDDTKYTRLNASVWGELDILKGLQFKSQYSYNYDGMAYEFFQPGNVTYNNGYVTKGNSNSSTTRDWTIQNTLTYDRAFGSHHINLLAGQSAESQKYFYLYGEATGWPYESIETLNVASTPMTASSKRSTYTNASFFGRVSYDFNEKYLLTASIRRDGSSRFGSNTKWGTFPSFSAGWKINEESFLKNVDWISLLKLRAAWGTSGNDRIGISTDMAVKDYPSVALLSTYNTSWNNTLASGVAASNIANNNLQWESTKSLDFGLDFYAFNNRLQMNFDFYTNKTDNLLFSVPIPYTTGFSSYTTNIGSIRNSGFEIDITSRNLTGPFGWETNLNLSHNRNKVLDMGSIESFTVSSYDAKFITKVGGPISQFYCYRTDGYLTSDCFDSNHKATVPILSGQEEGNYKYVDQNGDGTINSSDLVAYGNNLPDVTYGLTNRFSFKNFELSVLLQGQLGGDIEFLGGRHNDCATGGRRQFSRWVQCYKPDYVARYNSGDPMPYDYLNAHNIDMSWDGETPSIFGISSTNDDKRIYDATYLRIKNITFTYNLPKSIFQNTILSSAKIYVSLDNLKTFDNYRGFTPESNSFGNGTTKLGVDYSTYPLSRRCILGVNIVF